MADFDPKMIEHLQTVFFNLVAFTDRPALSRRDIEAMLRALPLSPDALNALWRGEATVVPNEPTEAMQESAHYVRSFHLFGNPMRGTDEVLSAGNAASPYARKDEP